MAFDASSILVTCCSKPYGHWQITLSEAKRSSGRAQQKQPGPELVAPARSLRCQRNSLTSRCLQLPVPDFLPPCPAAAPIGRCAPEVHLRADVSDVPTCEVGELLCFLV